MSKPTPHPATDRPITPLHSLVEATTAADHALTPSLLHDLVTILSATSVTLAGKAEFLLPCDVTGQPVKLPHESLRMVHDALQDAPRLHPWLATVDCNGSIQVLVARSLCHRIGIRHSTVQLILDHPTYPDYTFVQIRGFHKADAPGQFDMPCAGHAVGCDSMEASLHKELTEEIGITGDDLEGLQYVGHYEYRETTNRADFINVEWRTVFRARLSPKSMANLHFADGEVAALTMISRNALRELISHYPDRVASGLHGTLPWYGE